MCNVIGRIRYNVTGSEIAPETCGSKGRGSDMALYLIKRGIAMFLTYQRQKDEMQNVAEEITKLIQKSPV
jgi:ribosomal protein L27